MGSMQKLYREHVDVRQVKLESALSETGFDSLVIASGAPHTYFADDVDAPFHSVAHFAHWCPLSGPHHLLHLAPSAKPRLIRFAPEDYWYEPAQLGTPFWLDAFELVEAPSPDAVWGALGSPKHAAYIGNEPSRAENAGLAVNPESLVARLDWDRGYKTDYEIARLDEASALGGKGHDAARSAFESGASELEIHYAFVQAVGTTDEGLPYHTIIAIDEKGAFLHYEDKRTVGDGRVLLIDAGGQSFGYASDITRTFTRSGCDPRFVALRDGMNDVQQSLCDAIRPGTKFAELHERAHLEIAALLQESGLVRAEPEECVEKGLSRVFFPHGLGHHLGIQVHDVGGHLAAPDGTKAPPPEAHPYLRNTRTIEPGHVFTVEPGLYFIEMLLRPQRDGGDSDRFDWKLIDELSPLGGIRIEDNVVVTKNGHRNLTRPYLP
jgi:Xaa-Pro dipeptidase